MATIKMVIGAVLGLVLTLAVVFGIAVAVGWMQLPLTNIQREVTQHSQAYIEAHQAAVLHYYADYQSAGDDPHKNAARLNVCTEANLLDPPQWPLQASGFIQANCR